VNSKDSFNASTPRFQSILKHRPGKRVYRVIRVPESVAKRVHRRMEKDVKRSACD